MRAPATCLLAALLGLLVAAVGVASPAAAPTRPNIVVVFIDDMGWGDFSCFGNRDAKTPNVDRLASEGLRFSQFYVNAPICSPSRCALTTGQYPQRWRITSYLNNRADNARRGVANWLDPRAPTLPRILHDHGYATGHFGKWHLGGQRDVDDAPPISAYGFDESLTNFEGMGAKLLPLTLRPGQTEPGRIWADAERLGGPVTWMLRSQITGGFVDAAIAFVDRAASQQQPFYINVWPDDVHSPFWPPVEKWAEGKRGLYLSVLQEMDRQLGKLFDHLRDTPALRDNTLILVCSDNGPEPGAGSPGPFRGAKTRLYEGGIRSPLIVWGPGLIPQEKQGTHNDASVFAASDLVPSLLAVAGATAPAEVKFDGEDVSAALLGRSTASRSAPIFWRRPPDRKNAPPALPNPQPDLAVRDGNWKLLCNYDGTQPELYDLARDRAETTNLAEQQPEVVKRLTAAALAWHQSMPADNGPELGRQATQPAASRPGGVRAAAARKPNVLMILVDDLKPALGCYGDPLAKTPNIDRLAARGLRFDLAYCNQAVCAPSRFTLLLGSHPTSTGLYGLGSQLRQRLPDAVTLPQHFARQGYRTESLGKVFHIGHGNQGDPQSFSVEHFHDKVIEYADPASTGGGQLTREEAYFTNQQLGRIGQLPRGAAFESPDVSDETYADGRVASETVRRLQAARGRLDREGTPFFIVAGFVRPHLPFSAPRTYWDWYDPTTLPLPHSETAPLDAPAVAGKTNGELANYHPVPDNGVVDATLGRQLVHGYYASVSYVDAQIGKVLDELDRQQLADNTMVVLWGDHGFHLGDHGYWTKHTNYEQANRIPLIIAAPGTTQASSSTQQLAESVDLLPTLAELCGLPAPTGPQPIDGKSLVPVLRDPAARVRDHAYHCFPRGQTIGRAIRTERYRLVEWRKVGEPPESAELELYDYEADPLETRNLAAARPDVVASLRAMLAKYPEPVDPNARPAPRPAAAQAPHARRPDIVVFLTDDQGQLDCSPYGDAAIRTPNMQKLAESGMTFTRAYVASPSCAPSRAALLTGLMPARNGAEANHSKPRASIKKWPAYFQELGYEVVAFGKVSHYRHTADYAFDHFAHDAFHDQAAIPAAAEWLQQRPRANAKPLCLMVGTNWPHVPWPEEHLGYDPQQLSLPAGSIDTPETRHWRARYAAAVTKADDELGLILDAVRQHLPPETLFLFSADHGVQWPFGKWNLYESGVCVPLIAVWPGVIAPGSRSDALVQWTDLLPTLLEAGGGTAPDGIDGRSFLPVLRGETNIHRDRIFTTHSNDNRYNVYPSRAVRDGRWKYVRNLHPEYAFTTHIDLVAGRLGQRAFFSTWEAAAKSDPQAAAILQRYHERPAEELYDLAADPHEQHNLAADPQHAAELARLRSELDAWMKEQGDRQEVTVEPRRLSDPNSYGSPAAIER